MCGRFTLRSSNKDIAEAFGVLAADDLAAHYNIAPSHQVAAVRAVASVRQLAFLQWGLIPAWADDPAIGNRLINARAETVATKPAFRQAFKDRRCLVVADGFFEWKRDGRRKQPFYIARRDGRPFGFAGLWEHWRRGELAIDSCTVITTEPNETTRPVHDRMPVIVPPADYDQWLDPALHDAARLQALLRPCPADDLVAIPVSPLVNSPKNDSAECIGPLEAEPARLPGHLF